MAAPSTPGWPAPWPRSAASCWAFPASVPETADSILLYAGGRPTFVVDAYTRRLFTRLGLLAGDESYEQIRALFMTSLPADADLFNEFHALIVETCKTFCRKTPICPPCPLRSRCPFSRHV